MNSEISNQDNLADKHSDWLSQVEQVNDSEAAQVNGGAALEASRVAYEQLLAAIQKAAESSRKQP